MRWLAIAVLLIASPAAAGINDPWWGLYKRSPDSAFIERVGPFSDRYTCEGYRYKIGYPAVWLGCRQ